MEAACTWLVQDANLNGVGYVKQVGLETVWLVIGSPKKTAEKFLACDIHSYMYKYL